MLVFITYSLVFSILQVICFYSEFISLIRFNSSRVAKGNGMLIGFFFKSLFKFRISLKAPIMLVSKEHLSCIVSIFISSVRRRCHYVHCVNVLVIPC